MKKLDAQDQRILPPTCLFFALVAMLILHFLLPGKDATGFPWNLFGGIPLMRALTWPCCGAF